MTADLVHEVAQLLVNNIEKSYTYGKSYLGEYEYILPYKVHQEIFAKLKAFYIANNIDYNYFELDNLSHFINEHSNAFRLFGINYDRGLHYNGAAVLVVYGS